MRGLTPCSPHAPREKSARRPDTSLRQTVPREMRLRKLLQRIGLAFSRMQANAQIGGAHTFQESETLTVPQAFVSYCDDFMRNPS